MYLEFFGYVINSYIAFTYKKISYSIGINLSIYKNKIKNGDKFTPRDYFYYGNELKENGHYQKAIESYTKNINLVEGWIEDKFFACINRADCYRFLGKSDEELSSLLESFRFSHTPRPEVCSRIGFHYHQKQNYEAAIF